VTGHAANGEAMHFYPGLKIVHIATVLASGAFFALRGVGAFAGRSWVGHPTARYGAQAIDTLLLLSGISLAVLSHQYPFLSSWLTVKLVLLVGYVVLGVLALRPTRPMPARIACFALALCVYAQIAETAISHSPWGLAALLPP
jgi:uncharacterized membrane protein SirB2